MDFVKLFFMNTKGFLAEIFERELAEFCLCEGCMKQWVEVFIEFERCSVVTMKCRFGIVRVGV